MTDQRTTTPVIAEREDSRTDGPMTGGERAVLDHWLDLYRGTVLLKIAGWTQSSSPVVLYRRPP
ncbi:MAG: hypothetical protein ACR2JU_16080 [Nocardioidaceae bacterium]